MVLFIIGLGIHGLLCNQYCGQLSKGMVNNLMNKYLSLKPVQNAHSKFFMHYNYVKMLFLYLIC